ncbi:MAG TPA: sulfur carrier protein ThiS [Candidatus Omnitrophota bacterium]|nr:sulfur carrier protein ThiS [Candidatus Omnitrophota bacterium]
MKIRINGKEKICEKTQTLKDVIDTSLKNSSHIVAEVNGEIIKRHRWADITVQNGDSIELVALVAGG